MDTGVYRGQITSAIDYTVKLQQNSSVEIPSLLIIYCCNLTNLPITSCGRPESCLIYHIYIYTTYNL
jgi:hypothetical protein